PALLSEGREPGDIDWDEIARVRKKDLRELADFEILGAGEAPATLYVAVKPRDAGEGAARTIRLYDLKTRTLGPPVWPQLSYDVAAIVQPTTSHALSGVCYLVDTYTCDFKEPEMQRTFRGIAKFFHNERNVTP